MVLATLWSGTENALRLAGAKNLAGKVVIDATNPLSFTAGQPSLELGHTDSAGEQVPGGPPDMFICGNEGAAKSAVTEILTAFGWDTIDIGGIEGARLLEPLCVLWLLYGLRTNTWNHAFKLLRK